MRKGKIKSKHVKLNYLQSTAVTLFDNIMTKQKYKKPKHKQELGKCYNNYTDEGRFTEMQVVEHRQLRYRADMP